MSAARPHPFSLGRVLTLAAMLAHCLRDRVLLQTHTRALEHLTAQLPMPVWQAYATVLQSWGRMLEDQQTDSVVRLDQAMQRLAGLGMAVFFPSWLVLQAEAHVQVGQYAVALQRLHETLRVIETTGRRAWEAELYRLKGAVLLAQTGPGTLADSEHDRIAEAEACYWQALTIARRQAAKSWELRAALSLSRLWRQRGKQTEAHRLLADVYGWFTEGEATPDLQEARAVLETLA